MNRLQCALKGALSFVVLACFSSPSLAANASCHPINFKIINNSNQEVTINDTNAPIKAHQTGVINTASKFYYSRCGLVKLNYGKTPLYALLKPKMAGNISMIINPGGEVVVSHYHGNPFEVGAFLLSSSDEFMDFVVKPNFLIS